MLDPYGPDSFIISAEVHIIGIEPAITRKLELPVKLNFAELHEVLQAAFGWTDSHLHQFNVGGLTIGAPEFDEDGLADYRTFEATEFRLQDLTFPYDGGQTLLIDYQYDFGDNWRHHIVLRRVARESGVSYPRCVDGSRTGPPEDAGGPYSYADFVEAWRDPDHDDHKDMRRWVGRKFDPERFDIEATNKAISKALRAAKGNYRFRLTRSA